MGTKILSTPLDAVRYKQDMRGLQTSSGEVENRVGSAASWDPIAFNVFGFAATVEQIDPREPLREKKLTHESANKARQQ